MTEFILSLIKYTAIFACMLYAYTKLLRIKLKAWDLFDIPLFIALSAGLHFVAVYVKILVPIGLLIFGDLFLFLRFRKSFYETVTIGTIALSISIILMLPASIVGLFADIALEIIEVEAVTRIIFSLIVSIIQIVSEVLLFKINRFKSGVNTKGETATFEILLYISVGSIIAMMLFYTKNATQSMLEIFLIILAMFALLFILWWRKHITYNYREVVKRQNAEYLENSLKEYNADFAEKELQLAVYAELFHHLNKVMPDCALLAESAAMQTGDKDACAVSDTLKRVLDKMHLTNEKCSLKNIPQTGDRLIDAPIIQLYTAAERKNLTVSADISADVESWFVGDNLQKFDIHTILSYLCDNAKISALGSPNAKVRVELGETENKKPLIRIYDSGEQFDEKVLEKIGLEQVTTHAGDGGSGIGLFTVFKILKKYGASFTLDEDPQMLGFTKCIEIAFDGLSSRIVRTLRVNAAKVCSARKGITVEQITYEDEHLRDGTNG